MRAWKVGGSLGILIGLLLGGGLLSWAEATGSVTAAPGYTVESFATGLQNPRALALGSRGPFGGGLYVVEHPAGQETGRLVALDSLGQATLWAEGLRGTGRVAWRAEGPWGGFAYLVEGPGGEASGLHLVRVNPTGKAEPFRAVPGGTRAAGSPVFGPPGPWGEDLYLGDAAEGKIWRVSPEGTVSSLIQGLSGPRALALAPAGSPWEEGLYVATGPAVLRVGVDGQAHPVVEGAVAPSHLAFGEGGGLGTDLYLAESGLAGVRLLRVNPAGAVTLVAQGFGAIGGMALASTAPWGPALFVAEASSGVIYRIAPTNR
ncbi:MAG: hypothetical protein HYY20_04425 [Candidatus Tectomicrobia bacterium]|uniref:Uncharacterized protein n=1 Tax=Tectimicrobiota bacterium TaxID=2528274 RepID=A0A932CN41_UNCTE|nr:hypothetical protein [Candidatus Tectomicrobia bacterium]